MSTPAFTPGPWVLDTWGDECGDQFDLRMGDAVGNDFSHDAAHKIELYSGADAERCPEQYAEMRANGNLIAAAPDLYAALKELFHASPASGWEQRNATERAKAAIAKAEGR